MEQYCPIPNFEMVLGCVGVNSSCLHELCKGRIFIHRAMFFENSPLLFVQCDAFESVHSVIMIFLLLEIDHRNFVCSGSYLQFCCMILVTDYLCLELVLTLSLMQLLADISCFRVVVRVLCLFGGYFTREGIKA